jgi:hypothetical protein
MESEELVEGPGSHFEKNLMESEDLVEGLGSHPKKNSTDLEDLGSHNEKNLTDLEDLVEGPGSNPENLMESEDLAEGLGPQNEKNLTDLEDLVESGFTPREFNGIRGPGRGSGFTPREEFNGIRGPVEGPGSHSENLTDLENLVEGPPVVPKPHLSKTRTPLTNDPLWLESFVTENDRGFVEDAGELKFTITTNSC